jgi:hypothetical protein
MASASPSAVEFHDVGAVFLRTEDHDADLSGDGHSTCSFILLWTTEANQNALIGESAKG